MELVHKTDIALEPVDERDWLERSMQIKDDFYIPSSAKGIVKLILDETAKELNLKIGETVYFDPRMLVEIKELNLVVIDKKAVLIKGDV